MNAYIQKIRIKFIKKIYSFCANNILSGVIFRKPETMNISNDLFITLIIFARNESGDS